MAVVAGREVLKILSISESQHLITESLNLRAGSRNLNTSCNDVKWHPTISKRIATGATNGCIILWDVFSRIKQERIITEHSRSVNRITFSGDYLLSASQDGTMKLWDLRVGSTAKFTFEGKSESVRDVQFNPSSPYLEFAAAFENGTIQRWDVRFPRSFERKYSAHNGLALSLDWHPDGRYLASGGRDKIIKLWDLQQNTSSPCHFIQTIASVSRVLWKSDVHIGSCSLLTDSRIHIFNINRPHIPQITLDPHSNITMGFLFKDNKVWSVGKDKMFKVTNITSGYDVSSTMRMNGLSWNPWGDVFLYGAERKIISNNALTWSNSAQFNNVVDESLNEEEKSLIASTALYFKIKRPVHSASKKEMKLDLFQPASIQRHKLIPSETFDYEAFRYFAENYICPPPSGPLVQNSNIPLDHQNGFKPITTTIIQNCCLHNATVSLEMNHFQTYQTWSILSTFHSLEGVLELVNYYVEMGNIQMAYFVIKVFNLKIGEKVMFYYFEQLLRSKLYVQGIEIIKNNPYHSLRKLNQFSLHIQSIPQSTCSVCRTNCRGIYQWCQICSHGGHRSCIEKWFLTNNCQCPTGCGHKCVMKEEIL